PAAQTVEVGVINWLGLRRSSTCQQQAAQPQTILIFSNELAHVLAARAIAALVAHDHWLNGRHLNSTCPAPPSCAPGSSHPAWPRKGRHPPRATRIPADPHPPYARRRSKPTPYPQPPPGEAAAAASE